MEIQIFVKILLYTYFKEFVEFSWVEFHELNFLKSVNSMTIQ